jgi:chromosome segregation protein
VAQIRAALAAGAEEPAEQARREAARRREELEARVGALSTRLSAARDLASCCGRAAAALGAAFDVVSGARADLLRERRESEEAAEPGAELRGLAREEAELQAALRAAGEAVTRAEVAAQQARDHDGDVTTTMNELAGRLGLESAPSGEALEPDERERLEAAVARFARRREQLGPVNPLAGAEYEAALERVEELAHQRADLEAALAELEGVIREADRKIREDFDATFAAAARNFEEVVAELFPGGRGRLRLVKPDGPRPVIAGESADSESAADDEDEERERSAELEPGVEVEVTPAGKSMRRLSLLSGGEKSLVALGFLFAVFLARPCPFYILDEVEAALDDRNIDRFLALVRRCSRRAQFIVVTHQKRTMDAADRIYGVSMGGDGVSKVVSRRLRGSPEQVALADAEEAAA